MMSSGAGGQKQKQNINHNKEHQADPIEPPDDPEGRILLRQVDDGKSRRGWHRSTSACQLNMTANSTQYQAKQNPPSHRAARLPGGHLPTVSIAVHDYSSQGQEREGPEKVGGGRYEAGDDDDDEHSGVRRLGSASTTSDVNSYDDAASIASRLSQIVDEQEFLMINKQQWGGREGGKVAPSLSMGNLLLAYDGKPQRHKTASRGQRTDQLDAEREARSASVLAVNRLADGTSCEPTPGATSLSAENFPQEVVISLAEPNSSGQERHPVQRVRTKSFAGQGEIARAQAELSERRNESSGSLCTRPGQFQPERGNLRLLESSRQQAHLAATRLRSESVSGGGGGGDVGGLMLNIRRSAWKLDEFEQAFNADDGGGGGDHSPSSHHPGGGGGDPAGEARNSFRRSTRDLLFNSFRKVVGGGSGGGGPSPSQVSRDNNNKQRHDSVSEGVATTPDGSVKASTAGLKDSRPQQQQQQQVVNINLLNRSGSPPNKRRPSNSGSNLQLYQQQEQASGKNHLVSANLGKTTTTTTQARRGSRISLSSFASSLDSSKSAKPFGRLGELLAPSHRRKRQQKDARQGDLAGGGGGHYGDTPPRRRSGRASSDDPSGDDPPGSACCSLATLKQYFPVLEWLPAYKWRDDFFPDLTAGLAVAVLNISTSLSAAVVAETDLGVAFRSSIVNTLVYALLCSSRHTSFGSWSIMSQMLLDSVRGALSDELILSRINLGPQAYWTAGEYETWHMNIIIMYTFLIGLVQLAAGLLNLGNLLASFIPEALCSSMIAATAFTMAIGQLANMCGTSNKILWAVEKNTTEEIAWSLGLEESRISITDLFSGLFRWIQQIALLAKHYNQINLTALVISLICVLLLALNQYYLQAKLRKLLKKDNLFLPFEMILLILWICISYALDLPGAPYRVATCGPIAIEFGLPNLPNLRLLRELWFDSLATALISYTMVFIMARTYSNKLNYEINNNQELVACGAGNLVGGLFDALPATASFSRTAGQVEAGGRTQMASLINCLALTLVVQFFGHHVAQLPVCVMAATLFFGFVRMMTRFQEVFVYWRICKVDFAIWCVTFVAILTLDLVTGFVYGFIFSILTMLYRAQNRRCYLLGTIGSSADVYVPLAKYPAARELHYIRIFQFCGPIHYVCADLFERLLRQKTRVNVKEILKQMDQQQQQQQQQRQHQQVSTKLQVLDPRTRNLPTHIILDFSMISFIDSAGIHVIKKIIVDFQRINITIMLASLASHVAQVVKSEPSLWDAHKDRFYVTLADAVHHALRDNQQAAAAAAAATGSSSIASCHPPICTINK